ncbi:MAG: zinc ribbon domain-containing protein [Planctomycetota bacterium]|nr:MAG: zinc ribbon domain-containing protein [Planctomycetota bacterium]
MPLYEFHCAACDSDFEELVRTSEDAVSVGCIHCGSPRVTRKFSTFSARSGTTAPSPAPLPMGGCGRCGDPSGPCAL